MKKRKPRANRKWAVIALLLLMAPDLPLAEELPFVATFEELSEAPLPVQSEWHTAQRDQVVVTRLAAHGGERSLLVPSNAMVRLDFEDSTATNIWIDFYLRLEPRPTPAPPVLSAEAVAGFYIHENGHVMAKSNSSWVACSGFVVSTARWCRFTVNLDYGARRWALYAAGDIPNELSVPLATNLAFNAGATNTHFRSFRVKN